MCRKLCAVEELLSSGSSGCESQLAKCTVVTVGASSRKCLETYTSIKKIELHTEEVWLVSHSGLHSIASHNTVSITKLAIYSP